MESNAGKVLASRLSSPGHIVDPIAVRALQAAAMSLTSLVRMTLITSIILIIVGVLSCRVWSATLVKRSPNSSRAPFCIYINIRSRWGSVKMRILLVLLKPK